MDAAAGEYRHSEMNSHSEPPARRPPRRRSDSISPGCLGLLLIMPAVVLIAKCRETTEAPVPAPDEQQQPNPASTEEELLLLWRAGRFLLDDE